jgi:cell division protein FtsN
VIQQQRGGFVLGMVVGLLVGLAVALGVALFITKAPIPFVNKVPQRTAEMDSAEAERNRNWDPNAPLAGKPPMRPASAVVAMPAPPPVAAPASVPGVGAPKPAGKDPASILAGAPVPGTAPPAAPAAPPLSGKAALDPFVYFVQAGAFSRADEADQQRARLAMQGLNAKITEREQAGRVVYRVRLGPYPTRDEADTLQSRLQDQSIEAQIVRVEKP